MNRLSSLHIAGGVLFCLVPAVVAQEKVRNLDEMSEKFPNAPIEIVTREVGAKTFDGSRVIAGTDWLRRLSLTVRNISQKNIVKFVIHIKIPKHGEMQHDAGMALDFPSENPVLDPAGRPTGHFNPPTLRVLQPGATTKVKVWEHQLEILERLKERGVPDVDTVILSIREVVFDDGTGWLVGKESRDDPSRPGSQLFVRPDRPDVPFETQLLSLFRSALILAPVTGQLGGCPGKPGFVFVSAPSDTSAR